MGKTEHPFLDPLWRRIVLLGICLGWSGVEFYFGNDTWGMITLAISAYTGWIYLYAYKGSDPAKESAGAHKNKES